MECSWEVVGGATRGGIIVRDSCAITSAQAKNRLETGSVIRALQIDSQSGRLQYELLQGEGPSSGWVSTTFQGKALLVKATNPNLVGSQADADCRKDNYEPSVVESSEALQGYLQRLSKALTDELPSRMDDPIAHSKDVDSFSQASFTLPKTFVQVELDRAMHHSQGVGMDRVSNRARHVGVPHDIFKDADGETLHLCCQCSLPLGDIAYIRDGRYMHGECIAETMEKDLRDEDDLRRKAERLSKNKQRADFDIGWEAAHIPSNRRAATNLLGREVPDGMLCVVFDEGTKSVKVVPTTDPAAAVNLEYLSIALKVRRSEGHDPVFSLNPVNAKDKKTMQEKAFTPEWLAGTSVGEVLFQADYLLKELSMGDCEQPVVGMKSCFEFAETENCGENWNAREWFMVRKAEIEVSRNNVLIPYVKLGVEARAMEFSNNGLQDAPVTRADHPMVKYANSFTHHFDLIAERRSAIFHLRELAKAVVLAKFMVECKVTLHEGWFHLADSSNVKCSFGWEVPQLWHERMQSCLNVENGVIVSSDTPVGASVHGIYGGVNLSLEHFDLASSLAGRSLRDPRGGRAPVPPSSSLGLYSMEGLKPKGVDLRLEKFDLATLRRTDRDIDTTDDANTCIAVGSDFWREFDRDSESLNAEQKFFHKLFNPRFSDRRMENDLFVPPRSDVAYVEKLNFLLHEEVSLKQKRKDAFFNKSFDDAMLGSLFPPSWLSESFLRRSQSTFNAQSFHLAEPHLIDVIKTTTPLFDASTEDGTKFRIYSTGSLEVRTVQDVGGAEVVGGIFLASSSLEETRAISNKDEKIVKVTEFVDRAVDGESNAALTYYIVLETGSGNKVLTERSLEGTLVWQENPGRIESRTSSSKTLRSAECSVGTTLRTTKEAAKATLQSLKSSVPAGCAAKHYCRSMHNLVCGKAVDVDTCRHIDSTWVRAGCVGKVPFPSVERKPSEYKLMAQLLK